MLPTRRTIRAPRESGQCLIDPPLETAAALIERNRQSAVQSPAWLQAMIAPARQHLVSSAEAHRGRYGSSAQQTFDVSQPLILSGHQPTLFHPGVWFKNFALSSLAAQLGGHGVNLIVDNDVARETHIRVPAGDAARPRVELVPLDRPSLELPHEERMIVDRSVFTSFPERVQQAGAAWLRETLAHELWQRADQLHGDNLGESLAALRHLQERDWGLNTAEIPLSRAFAHHSFAEFALRLLFDLPRFSTAYNAALADYRQLNGLRSTSHPVPDLAPGEAPLWIWSREVPLRRRLYVEPQGQELEISDRGALRLRVSNDLSRAVEQWQDFEQRGIKIRPRALMTTLFARLVLCDLFLHGIGGAKYDEVTDSLMARYFGRTPPEFTTLTATFQLPLDLPRVTEHDVRKRFQQQRELSYHGERWAPESRAACRKRELLSAIPTRGERKAWHRALVAVNEELSAELANERVSLMQQLQVTTEQHRQWRLLGSREFSFVLYPAEFIRSKLQRFASFPSWPATHNLEIA